MDLGLPEAAVLGVDIKDPKGHRVHTIKDTSLTLLSVDQTGTKRDWKVEPCLGDVDTSWPHPWALQSSSRSGAKGTQF